MKFYIVDNGSLFTYEAASKILHKGHNVFIQKYSPYSRLDSGDTDVIVLTGGYQYEVGDVLEDNELWFRHEFELIRTTDKPILGLCLGHQLINVALGGTMLMLPRPVQEVVNISITEYGQNKLGYTNFNALEHHDYAVDDFSATGLIELGSSKDGVEMLYHPERKLLGVQFHPEIFVDDDSESLFWDLIGLIHSPVGAHRES
ncbi:MAG: gamma-glutamyl-gamma-aminobutyrate hydrolase family protein [Patescibacteria group bacterium]|nr:gamma-glutamyl-gamma-aminobutyrate hydrolase family protein [Patescibacteria group bacterium]